MTGPMQGLPERLPAEERILWQGAPDWRVLARRTFHAAKLAGYFALLVAWVAQSSWAAGATAGEVALAVLRAGGLSLVPLAVIAAYAAIVARMTVYTVTDRRVVLRIGVALPLTINLPFAQVASADLRSRADGSGDIALTTEAGTGLAYLLLWPHARPWRMRRAEPALRGLRDVQPVARVLARALAASAEMPAPVLQSRADAASVGPHVAAAA